MVAGDDEQDDWPVLHLVRPAAECEPPQAGLRSVFDLHGVSPAILKRMAASLGQHGRTGHDPAFSAVARNEAGVRCIGARYPADRWTAERAEKEALRRARQRPPKPVKKARTKSRKLRELIGEGASDLDA